MALHCSHSPQVAAPASMEGGIWECSQSGRGTHGWRGEERVGVANTAPDTCSGWYFHKVGDVAFPNPMAGPLKVHPKLWLLAVCCFIFWALAWPQWNSYPPSAISGHRWPSRWCYTSRWPLRTFTEAGRSGQK